MYRRAMVFVICVILVTVLTSCFDAREMDENMFVLSIGIDKGISDVWRITFQFNRMIGGGGKDGGGGGGGGSESEKNEYPAVTIDAPSFFAAANIMNTSVSRRLNFSHTKYLVVSDEIAKDGSLSELIAPMVRFREIRQTMYIIISRGVTAEKFIMENRPYIGTLLSKNQEDLIKESFNTGYFPRTNLNDLYSSIKSPYRQSLIALGGVNEGQSFEQDGVEWSKKFKVPAEFYAGEVPRRGNNKIELFGSIVANGGKMVGELTGNGTKLLMIIRGDYKMGVFTLQDPEKPDVVVPVNVMQKKKPEVTIRFEDGKPIIHVRIMLEGEIYSIQSWINYEDPKKKSELEKAFVRNVKDDIDKTVEKCLSLKSDVFEFGGIAVKHFRTIGEWEAYNWEKQFGNAKVTTEMEFTIRRAGTMIDSSPILPPQEGSSG